MSNAAQDEFNNLIARNAARTVHHPADGSSASSGSDSESSDLPKTTRNHIGRSIRSSNAHYGIDGSDDSDDDFADRYGTGGFGSASGAKDGDRTHLPNGSRGVKGKTGPKGVIADAWAAERERRAMTDGSGKTGAAVLSRSKISERTAAPRLRRKGLQGNHNGDDLDDDADTNSEEEDDYVRKWREMRINELGSQRGQGSNGSRMKGGRYGTVEVVDALGYLEAVEASPAGLVVVVYIFDDELPVSEAYSSHLSIIASKYTSTRFIALHYEDAEMEHAGIPAILAYRNGDKFADMVPLVDEVPFTCNVVTNLEEALKRNGIL